MNTVNNEIDLAIVDTPMSRRGMLRAGGITIGMAGYDRFAPIRHIRQWKTPTLILHGELDYRCPIGEGLNLFEALQYHGVDSELVVFPDENHWIMKPRNIVAWYENVLGFLAKHMP